MDTMKAASFQHAVARTAVVLVAACVLPILAGCPFSVPNPPPPGVTTVVAGPLVALDGNGFATVTYHETTSVESNQTNDGSNERAQSRRYEFSQGRFGDVSTIATGSIVTPLLSGPILLASDQSGTAIAIFASSFFSDRCRFAPGQEWVCENGLQFSRALAMDGAGRALTLGGDPELTAIHFAPGNGWGVEQALSSLLFSDFASTSKDTLAYWGGVGYAVWVEGGNVRASRFLQSTGVWEPFQALGGGSEGPFLHVASARSAPDAGVLVIWKNGSENRFSRYVPGSGWQAPQPFPGPPGGFLSTQIAMAGSGDAIVVGEGAGSAVVAVRLAGGSWEPPQTIGTGLGPGAPRIAMDGAGNAIALWVEDGSKLLVANRYFVGNGWQGSTAIGTLSLSSDKFDLDMDTAGRAMAVWVRDTEFLEFEPDGTRVGFHVFGAPIAQVTFNPSVPEINQPITLDASRSTDEDGTIVSYEWDFNYDGGTFDVDATGITAQLSFASAGDKRVALRVRDNVGNGAIAEVWIPVAGGPPGALSVALNGSGRVTSTPGGIDCSPDCTETFANGLTVTLNPVADPGWLFVGWSGDPDCTDGRVVMIADKSCTARFAVADRVTIIPNANGTVTSRPAGITCGPTCAADFPRGSMVSLTFASAINFARWGGDCAPFGTAPSITLTLTGPITCSTDLLGFSLSVGTVSVFLGSNSESQSVIFTTRTGYNGVIALSALGCSQTVQCTVVPDHTVPGADTAVLRVATVNAAPGDYVITVRGVGGGVTREDSVLIQVR